MVSLCLWTLSSPPSSSTVRCVCLSPCLFSLVSLGQLLSLFPVFQDGGVFGSRLFRAMLLSSHLSGVSLRRHRVCVFVRGTREVMPELPSASNQKLPAPSPQPALLRSNWHITLHKFKVATCWFGVFVYSGKIVIIALLTPPSCHCKYPFLVIWDPLVLATFKYITTQCC